MVENKSSIQEREQGMYVTWVSKGVPYELNMTRIDNKVEESDKEVNVCWNRQKGEPTLMIEEGDSLCTDRSWELKGQRMCSEMEEVRLEESEDDEEGQIAVEWAQGIAAKQEVKLESTPLLNQQKKKKVHSPTKGKEEVYSMMTKRRKVTGKQ